MYQKLVNHNDDIKRLVDKGYAVSFDSNYLVVRDIPYLNNQGQLQIGAIVSKMVFIDNERVTQEDHQIFFAGSVPHNIDGVQIPNLGGGPTQLALSNACNDIVVQRSFSNKPRSTGKYNDFFDKIESYVGIISGPAVGFHNANPYTFRLVDVVHASVFKYHDTLTSRAEITDLSAKFKDDIVAIIGLGGTGAYVLDYLIKTPVREIWAFDPDLFHVHNAFRSPGRLDSSELNKTKAEVYRSRYDDFRNGISIIPKFIDSSSIDELQNVTFAFVCVDKGSSRSSIFDLLISKGIPFIDVGMGLNRKNNSLNGMIRTTFYDIANASSVRKMKWAEEYENQNDQYRNNIQIGELNALNASLAVIKYKQIRGFYFNEATLINTLFEIGDMKIVGEDQLIEN